VLNSDGKTTMEIDEEKEIEIKKGFNSNSIVVFKGKGNQHPSKLPSDLVFEIH
jgi:DnaJ-class molecular chaperone